MHKCVGGKKNWKRCVKNGYKKEFTHQMQAGIEWDANGMSSWGWFFDSLCFCDPPITWRFQPSCLDAWPCPRQASENKEYLLDALYGVERSELVLDVISSSVIFCGVLGATGSVSVSLSSIIICGSTFCSMCSRMASTPASLHSS